MSSLVDVDKHNDQLLEDELADLLNEETQNLSNADKYRIPGTFFSTRYIFAVFFLIGSSKQLFCHSPLFYDFLFDPK